MLCIKYLSTHTFVIIAFISVVVLVMDLNPFVVQVKQVMLKLVLS